MRAKVDMALTALPFVVSTLLVLLVSIIYVDSQHIRRLNERLSVEPEREYYRGLYDACVLLTVELVGFAPDRSMRVCLTGTQAALESNWFGQPSEGWVWPPYYRTGRDHAAQNVRIRHTGDVDK